MAYVAYKKEDDGSYTFMDDSGQQTQPMAGPAAEQQARKLDMSGAVEAPGMQSKQDVASGVVPPPAPIAPPQAPIRGERAELSPEMLQAGMGGDDLRTASNEHTTLGTSVLDAGGAPGVDPKKAELENLIRTTGMSPKEAVEYTKRKAAEAENWNAVGSWVKKTYEKLSAPAEEKKKQERIAAGLPPEAPKTAAPAGAEFHNEQAPHAIAPGKVVMAGGGVNRMDMPTVFTNGAGAGGPTHRVEMQTGRHTQEQKTVYGDEDQVALKQAGQAQYNAADDMGLADIAQQNSLAKEKEDQISQMRDAEQQRQAREQGRQEEAQKRMGEIDQLRTDVGAKIDPNQYWSDKSATQKMAAALLMGVGAYVQAMGGGPNAAMQIFNKAADENIDAQKANIQAKRGKLEDAKGAMAEFMKNGANAREAEHLTKLGMLDDANRRLDLTISQTNNPKIKAQAEARKADIQAQYAKEQAEMGKTVVGQTKQYGMATVGGGAGARQEVLYDDVKKEQVARGPDDKVYEFGEGATAQKAAERLGELGQNKDDAEKLQSILENPGYIADASKRAEANAIAKRIAIHAGKAEGANGRINEGYFKAIEDAISNGDVNSLTNFGKSAAIKEYRAGLETEARGIISQHAISRVEPFLVKDLSKPGARELKFVRKGNVPKRGPSILGAQVGE